jgi:hypothetical protein
MWKNVHYFLLITMLNIQCAAHGEEVNYSAWFVLLANALVKWFSLGAMSAAYSFTCSRKTPSSGDGLHLADTAWLAYGPLAGLCSLATNFHAIKAMFKCQLDFLLVSPIYCYRGSYAIGWVIQISLQHDSFEFKMDGYDSCIAGGKLGGVW